MYEKFQSILDNYINGNWHNFRTQSKGLPKIELLQFIQFWSEQEMESEGAIIRILISQWKLK